MSKKYRNKSCVYCGISCDTATADHVFPRSLFNSSDRDGIPKVPACKKCNQKKSTLEHYLVTVLPFASRLPDGAAHLSNVISRKLNKNEKLRRELSVGKKQIWLKERGILQRSLAIELRPNDFLEFMRLATIGLAHHHFEISLTSSDWIGAGLVTETGQSILKTWFIAQHGYPACGVSLGQGKVRYEGIRLGASSDATVWRCSLLHGAMFADSDYQVAAPDIWMMTAKQPSEDFLEWRRF